MPYTAPVFEGPERWPVLSAKTAHRDGSAEDERDRLRRAMQELRQLDDALEEVQSLEQTH